MSTSWITYENGAKKGYVPTTEDLQDIEDAFGPPETITRTISRGFFQGVGGQIGFSSAQGLHSAAQGLRPSMAHNIGDTRTMSDWKVTLCKNRKIKPEDLRGMASQLQRSAQRLAEAEMAKNQAIEAYKEVFARTFDHIELSMKGPELKGVGALATYDVPDLMSYKMQEQKACSEYNHNLLKWAQEKAQLERMYRAYNKQNNGGDGPGFWISIGTGFFGFIFTLFSSNF